MSVQDSQIKCDPISTASVCALSSIYKHTNTARSTQTHPTKRKKGGSKQKLTGTSDVLFQNLAKQNTNSKHKKEPKLSSWYCIFKKKPHTVYCRHLFNGHISTTTIKTGNKNGGLKRICCKKNTPVGYGGLKSRPHNHTTNQPTKQPRKPPSARTRS